MRCWIVAVAVMGWAAVAAAAPVVETLVPDHQASADAELLAADYVLDHAQRALDSQESAELKRALGEYRERLKTLRLEIVRARAQGQLTSGFIESCKARLALQRERLTGWLAHGSREAQGPLRHTLRMADQAYHQLLVDLLQHEVYSRHTSMQPINQEGTP